jgi:integrase
MNGGSMSSKTRKRRQKGTGTVLPPYTLKDGDQTFYVQFYAADKTQVKEHAGKVSGYDLEDMPPYGTRGRESEGWTKGRAERYLRYRIGNVEQEKWTKPVPVIFSEYAQQWYDREKVLRSWSISTTRSYRLDIERLNRYLGRKKITDITRSQINDLKADLHKTLGEASVNHSLTVLHMILEHAHLEDKLIRTNPAHRIKRLKVTPYKPYVLSSEEARRIENSLREAGKEQERLAFVTFEFLGLRFKELRGLRWRDIDFVEGKLIVAESKTKEGEGRSVPIPDILLEQFMQHMGRVHYNRPDSYVFHHPTIGSKWEQNYYRAAFKEAVKAAGIEIPEGMKIRPAHDLRVASATFGIIAGESIPELMERGGWKNYGTMQPYLKLAGKVNRDQANKLAASRLGAVSEPHEA